MIGEMAKIRENLKKFNEDIPEDATSSDKGLIEVLMLRLNSEIKSLDNSLERLFVKLVPVLEEGSVVDSISKGEESYISSPLARLLESDIRKVQVATESVEAIIKRIQL